ncbi:MAG: methyl-accepting chemotaxis protein [Lachnospiraceae bacterium]|nr:methyl-accepting chemotaxis protein [Lachnospiraceae bacterium]MDD7334611.1 methyl-accepting chemotaxis protein [Lachnospiraceae bacterium]MDY5522125.1 methyl-accepting chemotaxis protein [Agathobacter sp.]
MGRKTVNNGIGTVQEGLNSRIGRTFATILRKALIIICLESILIGGVLAILYTLKDNRNAVKEYTGEIDRAMQSKVSMLEAIASGISSGTLEEREDIQSYVDYMAGMDDQVSAVYSCYDENITIMSGGWQPPADFIVTEREWYKAAQANPDEVYISDPYVDEQSGGFCITLSKATYHNGKVAGVVGMDMYMDNLVSLIEESFSQSSYVFLATSDGTILVHPNDEYALSLDNTPTVQSVNGGRYASLVQTDMRTKLMLDYKGGFKLGIGNTSEVTGWKVVSVEPIYSIFIFFALIIGLNFVIYFVTLSITRKDVDGKLSILFQPLESISGKMTRVAEGDLSVVFDEEKNSLEIERLTDSINETIASLRSYIDSISNTVTAISDKNLTVTVDGEFKGSYVQIKDALESIVGNLNESFRQISREAESVLDYADRLAKTTETVAQSASLENDSVINVSDDMVRLTEQTRQITESALDVRKTIETTNQHLEVCNHEMDDLVSAMASIDQCYEEIADFVGTIKDIAAQTNLLSLNASIEAARAGEAGRGFAVVAEEISTLATSSAQASENINKLIEASQSAVATGKKLVEATSGMIAQGMSDSVQSKQHIDRIVEFVENQQRAIEDVNQEMKEVAEVVENNAASAEENTAISQQLNECAQSLKQTADSFVLE